METCNNVAIQSLPFCLSLVGQPKAETKEECLRRTARAVTKEAGPTVMED